MAKHFDRRTLVRAAALGAGGVVLGPVAGARAAACASDGDVYVDRAVGSDANSGTTPGAPFRTIKAARIAVLAADQPSRILLSGGSEDAPYAEWVSQFSTLAHPLLIRPAEDTGRQWLTGASSIAPTAAWTDQGGGVFSTPNSPAGPTSGGLMWTSDPARLVRIGGRLYPSKLRQTTGTQSAPKSGEYGETGGRLYVKLLSLASPAGSRFWLARLPRVFSVSSNAASSLVTFERLHLRGFLECGVLLGSAAAPEGTGHADHVACHADMCGFRGGFATTGVWSRSRSYLCVSERNSNDGFNYHTTATAAPLAQEYDCVGRANGDTTADSAQGTAPHENVRLQIRGGEYDYNVSGGLVAINSSVVELRRSTLDNSAIAMIGNQRGKDQGGIHAGLGISDNAHATVFDPMIVTNSRGPNIKVAASASLTGAALITSAGGGAPDILGAT